MKDFLYRYPGLNPEEARIRYKIWLKERETENKLFEDLKKKSPFSIKKMDNDTGDYSDTLFINANVESYIGSFGEGPSGIVTDAAIYDAKVFFNYSDGKSKWTTSDINGKFKSPLDFNYGNIIVSGGTDTVTGESFNSEYIVNSQFFFKYGVISPFTHIVNYIKNNLDYQNPEEALELVLSHLPDFIGISINSIDKVKLFNSDPLKSTLQGINGAKEIQAINTFLEIITDLIGNTESNHEGEVKEAKKKAYLSISEALLDKIKNKEDTSYHKDVYNFHKSSLKNKHKECCQFLIDKAYSFILASLQKNNKEASMGIQATNLIVKSEWSKKALMLTPDDETNENGIWANIKNKNLGDILPRITLPKI